MLEPIPMREFEERVGTTLALVDLPWTGVKQVVSLRSMERIQNVTVMPEYFLRQLIHSVPLEGDSTARPYKGCEVRIIRMDPRELLVAQTFVERQKYIRIVEDLSTCFKGFCTTHGFAKCIPLITLGETADKKRSIAFYVPPIVERHDHDSYLTDGTHRNYLIKATGTTIESVSLKGIKAPFPCAPNSWKEVVVVDAKPPREKRFNNLQREFFRNLTWVGIDG